jgi:hypothetical protein
MKAQECCKVNACTSFYVVKWLLHRHLDQTHGLQMQLGRFRRPSIHPGDLRWQDHIYMNVEQSTYKVKMEWEEGLWLSKKRKKNQVWWISNRSTTNARGTTALVGMFNLRHVVGHHWHYGMGVGFIPQSALV